MNFFYSFQKNAGQRATGLNDTERSTEPMSSSATDLSPSSAPQTSRDWLKEFPEPRSLEEAEQYYLKFLVIFVFSFFCSSDLVLNFIIF